MFLITESKQGCLGEGQLTHNSPHSLDEALVMLWVIHYEGMQLHHVTVYCLLCGGHLTTWERKQQ